MFDRFERRDYPEIDRVSFIIRDDYSGHVDLSPEQAYLLLQWLDQQKGELHKLIHQSEQGPDTGSLPTVNS